MLDFGFYNMDCLEGMRQFPDNYFDLAIVDPPYGDAGGAELSTVKIPRDGFHGKTYGGGGVPEKRVERTGGTWAAKFGKNIISWDVAPEKEYFDELFRVSRNQIIWGGNYFELPPTRCFLIWRKTNVPENFSMAMCEYAWTSFNANAKMFEFSAVGQSGRFHPTQKPIELYKWVISNYANEGDTILDTHVGSASSLIACHQTGHKFVGFEIDPGYYEKAKSRLEVAQSQISLFDIGEL